MGRDGFQWFVGVVEDRNDPQQIGRVRVRCLGYHTEDVIALPTACLLYTSPSPRDATLSRMPSSA